MKINTTIIQLRAHPTTVDDRRETFRFHESGDQSVEDFPQRQQDGKKAQPSTCTCNAR